MLTTMNMKTYYCIADCTYNNPGKFFKRGRAYLKEENLNRRNPGGNCVGTERETYLVKDKSVKYFRRSKRGLTICKEVINLI